MLERLRRLFNIAPPNQLGATPPPPARQLVFPGEIGRLEGISETAASRRKIALEQCKYGKLVQFPGGPIVPYFEHRITGRSPNFKFPEGHAASHYGKLWNYCDGYSYPWGGLEGGEIIKQAYIINDVPYIFLACIGLRSEGGKKSGRPYHEYYFLALPASSWSVALVPQLADMLLPGREPLTEINNNLPLVTVNIKLLDAPLPAGWFSSNVEMLVANILSGRCFGIDDRVCSEKEFLQNLFYALLCFPEEVARSVSFGTGCLCREPRDLSNIRIRHGFSGRPLMRAADGRWEDKGGGHPFDLSFGKRYLGELRSLGVERQATPRKVIKLAADLPLGLKTEALAKIFPS